MTHDETPDPLLPEKLAFLGSIVEKYGPGPHVFSSALGECPTNSPGGSFSLTVGSEPLTRAEHAEEAQEMR